MDILSKSIMCLQSSFSNLPTICPCIDLYTFSLPILSYVFPPKNYFFTLQIIWALPKFQLCILRPSVPEWFFPLWNYYSTYSFFKHLLISYYHMLKLLILYYTYVTFKPTSRDQKDCLHIFFSVDTLAQSVYMFMCFIWQW